MPWALPFAFPFKQRAEYLKRFVQARVVTFVGQYKRWQADETLFFINTFAIVPRKARDIGKGDEESVANP